MIYLNRQGKLEVRILLGCNDNGGVLRAGCHADGNGAVKYRICHGT